MKQKNLLILVGAPGSGKSTWAKDYIEHYNNGLYISRDEVRFSLLGENDSYFSKEDTVFRKFCSKIRAGLLDNTYDYVIADATHLNQMSRHRLLSSLGGIIKYANLIAVVFNTSEEECIRRNDLRTGRSVVPAAALSKMYRSMTDPENDTLQTFSEIWYVDENGEVI